MPIDLHLHLLAGLGGHLRDACPENPDALFAPARASPGSGLWLPLHWPPKCPPELALGLLPLGPSECGSHFPRLACHQRAVL